MRMKILYTIAASLILFSFHPALAQTAGEKYHDALEAIHSRDPDNAYMYLNSICRDDPESVYRQQALFACGEYYFHMSDYTDAFSTFLEFIEDYPDSKVDPYALFYLLKIAKIRKNDSLVSMLEKEIRDLKRVILVFKETKEYTRKYKSLFGRKYTLVYHIDRVECTIDGEILEQVFY